MNHSNVICLQTFPQPVDYASGLLLGGYQLHVVHAVAGRIWALVSGDRHTDLGSAEAAPVLQLDLPELTCGWWFGKRRGQCPEDGEAHTEEDHGHRYGHEDLENQHLFSLRAAPIGHPWVCGDHRF